MAGKQNKWDFIIGWKRIYAIHHFSDFVTGQKCLFFKWFWNQSQSRVIWETEVLPHHVRGWARRPVDIELWDWHQIRRIGLPPWISPFLPPSLDITLPRDKIWPSLIINHVHAYCISVPDPAVADCGTFHQSAFLQLAPSYPYPIS